MQLSARFSIPNKSSHSVLPASVSPPVHSPPRLALLTSCKLFQMLFPKLYRPLIRRRTPPLLLRPPRLRYISQKQNSLQYWEKAAEVTGHFAIAGSIVWGVCYLVANSPAVIENTHHVLRPHCTDSCRKSGFTCGHGKYEGPYCHECSELKERDNS